MFLPEKSVEKKGELVEAILQLVSSLSIEERKEVLDHLQQKSGGIPISIFRSSISGLEAIVVYLKDVKGLSVGKISELLNRKKKHYLYHLPQSKTKTNG